MAPSRQDPAFAHVIVRRAGGEWYDETEDDDDSDTEYDPYEDDDDHDQRFTDEILTNGRRRRFLSAALSREYFQGVVQNALDDLKVEGNPLARGATITSSGPACTLTLYPPDIGKVTVDIVPAFKFSIQDHPRVRKCFLQSYGDFFLVPKRSGREGIRRPNRMWRFGMQVI